MSETTIYNDCTTDCIVKYLKDELNRRNPIPNTLIVNTTRNFDDYNVPTQDYPVLKVYRVRSQYMPSNKRKSTLQLQYGLALPEQYGLLPYLNWVDININKILSFAIHDINIFIEPMSKACEYRTLTTELGIPVYSFLRFSFNTTEGIEGN
ncbi:hypothetical protein [Scytonema sp. NUACC26]|uniref:hypothetical protein n=1 Tax=Scytonema sp. NUACC26 TaxID=3140176 RepID=UPI0034DC844E